MACEKQLLEPKRANRRALGLRTLWFRVREDRNCLALLKGPHLDVFRALLKSRVWENMKHGFSFRKSIKGLHVKVWDVLQ